jgi:hypothetical protein
MRALRHASALERLSLRAMGVRDEAAVELGRGLFAISHLRFLCLAGNDITAKGMLAVLQPATPAASSHRALSSLEEVDIFFNHLSGL